MITAGVSAQGKAAPPIFDAIIADTSNGIIGKLNFSASFKQINVNNRMTVRLFMNNEVAYITIGSSITIKILFFLE